MVLLSALLLAAPSAATVIAQSEAEETADPRIGFSLVADGFERPLLVTNAGDGSGRMFVVEQTGRVKIIRPDGSTVSDPYLDLMDRVFVDAEAGLLGMAFHPGFTSNGRVFVTYTRLPDGDALVIELIDVDGAIDADQEQIVLSLPQSHPQHNTGTLAFDRAGMLLVGTGDGGGVGGEASQDLGRLYGKILRIDVDASRPYGIPSGNGYSDNPTARPEIHAIGLRNPWRFSVDPATGHVYIGDVGSIYWEEINLLREGAAGNDFGWNLHEGPQCSHWQPFCDVTESDPPVLAYTHIPGSAVVGGHVYRGEMVPSLLGMYLYGDWGTGDIWAAASEEIVAGSAEPIRLGSIGAGRLTSFGQDEAGELYVVDGAEGRILKIVDEGAGSP